jgi:alkylated DNA nucleotide flippase Atl1
MVYAQPTTLRELLEGARQYQVPLYQRPYSWTEKQLERLWDDLLDVADARSQNPETSHFIGSLVLAPGVDNGVVGVSQFLVIDGQQRLTTLSILLCALRDYRIRHDGDEHRDRINEQFLINKYKGEQFREKLVPTQADRDAYRGALYATPTAGGADQIGNAYRFVERRLAKLGDADPPVDVEQLEQAVLSGLELIAVTTGPKDNPHRIFESLNNTGLKLTQGDLVRNYLFMRLPQRGEEVYSTVWKPMQESLTPSEMELLFWLDLAQQEPRTKQPDTYSAQQQRLEKLRTEQEIEDEVRRFARLSRLLRVILHPDEEEHPLVQQRLIRLRDWGTTTVYPLLLRLLELRGQGNATSEEIAAAMHYLESFFVRRLLIGRATAGINRHLLSAVTMLDPALPVDQAVRKYLSTGRKYYAGDDEIREAVRAVPYYFHGRAQQRSLLLRWLEETYGSKEPVELGTLTIEHVLPQTLTPEWRAALSEDLGSDESVETVHAAITHTLGNLTLTGYNSALSNSPFATKRAKLAQSGVRMNQEIAEQTHWGCEQILSRADALAERIIENWPGPSQPQESVADSKWDVAVTALAQLQHGAWTTYGDVAALVGTSAIAVGQWLAKTAVPNAHRVLQADGTIADKFVWLDPGCTDEPRDVLEADGVVFDAAGRAATEQRLSAEDLAISIGADLDEAAEDVLPGLDIEPRDRFLAQLRERQDEETASAVRSILQAWTDMGGSLGFGAGDWETSCFLLSRVKADPRGNIWPAALYPSGKFELVFQHMRIRAPFEDYGSRDEFRQRLNKIPGVDLPTAKLDLRPGFELALLRDETARNTLVEALEWFHERAWEVPL